LNGCQEELALLSRRIAEEGCQVASVLGMGSIGKSVLTFMVMQQAASGSSNQGQDESGEIF
jgi:hypothetical protein